MSVLGKIKIILEKKHKPSLHPRPVESACHVLVFGFFCFVLFYFLEKRMICFGSQIQKFQSIVTLL